LLTIYVIFAAVHMRKVCQGSILKVEDDIICHCVRTCNDKKSISEKKLYVKNFYATYISK